MADNYLEKRMEELRSGKLGVQAKNNNASASSQSNKIQFGFSPKRILILDGLSDEGLLIAETFRKTGCKVAFINSNKNDFKDKLYQKVSKVGYIACMIDNYEESDAKINYILSNWRGIDIIINFDSKFISTILLKINQYLTLRPSPSLYIPRILSIYVSNLSHNVIETDLADTNFPIHFQIISNPGASELLKRMIQFLSLPEANQLNQKQFFV